MDVDSNALSQFMQSRTQPGQTFDKDMLKEILDSSALLDTLELQFRGLTRKPIIKNIEQDGQTTQILVYEYEVKKENALLNDAGIDFIMSQLRGLAENKDIKLSNLNVNEAYKLMQMMGLNVLRELFINYEHDKFGIKSMTGLVQVYDIFLPTVVALFKRSFEQGERKFIKDTTQETRMVTNQQRGGFGLHMGGKKS